MTRKGQDREGEKTWYFAPSRPDFYCEVWQEECTTEQFYPSEESLVLATFARPRRETAANVSTTVNMPRGMTGSPR